MARLKTNLKGAAFLRELENTRNAEILEALWRADEPALCVRLVDHIAATQDLSLGALLLEEYLTPRQGSPVLESILRAASSKQPPLLSRPDAERLVARLRAEQPRQGVFPPIRPHGERWALAQEGREVLAFAKEIATEDMPYSGKEDVLNLARKRIVGNEKLSDDVATRLSERLKGERSQVAWKRAAGFLDRLPPDRRSSAIDALTEQVVELAPTLAQEVFSQALTTRVGQAPEAARRRLAQGPIPNGAGGQSLVQVIEIVDDPETRGVMTALVLLRHPDLYGLIWQRAAAWSAEEWSHRLRGLAAADRVQPNQYVIDFLGRCPPIHAPLVMQVAARHGGPDHQGLRQAAAAKVRSRWLELVTGGFCPEAVGAFAWPSSIDDPVLATTKAMLKDVVKADLRGQLVGEAVALGSLAPEAAPLLLEPSDYAAVITPADLAGERLRTVAVSLYDAAPDHMHNVIRQAQGKGFDLDLARAIASRSPDAAFSGAATVYRDLPEDDKNELLGLLEAHGGWKQEELLSAIASETSPRAAARRIRAIKMTGRVAQAAHAAPAFVVDAVATSRLDLLEATFEVISDLQPRDVTLTRRLREIAESEGAPGRAAAASALDALTMAHTSALESATTHAERSLLLALLGATARPESIDTLLRHLGGEAEDDHPSVKQAAADALLDAVGDVRFTPAQIRQVGDRLDGPQSEGDPKARATLVDVLGRATLGEDQALLVLYDLIGRRPKGDAGQLFGQEKSRLLRAAALYKTSENLGEAGWPGMIEQLDNMAMCVTRAAYLVAGDNEQPKELIRSDHRRTDYGNLLNMLGGPCSHAKGPLLALHKARNDETEYPHPGSKPTQDTVTTARTNFSEGVKVLVGVLEKSLSS
jgi:hypothetical protein